MTLEDYLSHYLVWKEILMYLLTALGITAVAVTFIIVFIRITAKKDKVYYKWATNHIERFFEMIFSATSILSFLATYYLIDRFVTVGTFAEFWDGHKDFLLLILICMSCLINTFLDKVFVPLSNITKQEKASVRMTGMFYIILVFLYIKFIYGNDNYDGFIMYFLGLMIGRFVYFDASLRDFWDSFKDAAKNTLIMILGLACLGAMCYVGFKKGYLLISNGVLVSAFFAHIFLIVAIFIIYRSKIITLFVHKPKSGKKSKYVEEDEDEDEYYDSDEYYDDEYEDDEYEDEFDEYADYDEY